MRERMLVSVLAAPGGTDKRRRPGVLRYLRVEVRAEGIGMERPSHSGGLVLIPKLPIYALIAFVIS